MPAYLVQLQAAGIGLGELDVVLLEELLDGVRNKLHAHNLVAERREPVNRRATT